MPSFLSLLSKFFGVGYVLFWSSAFYPALIMNYKLKSSDALSLDSLVLNVVGYCSYFITIYLQLYNPKVVKEYEKVYKTKPILSLIDLFYASHCLICICVTVAQVVYYRVVKLKRLHGVPNSVYQHRFSLRNDWKHVRTVLSKTSASTKYLLLALTILILVSLYKAFVAESLSLLVLTKVLTLVKLFINCIKFLPQILLNYKNKSVQGYPFLSIYFDLAGGTMSLCQIVLDNYLILVHFKNERPINRMGIEIDHNLRFSLVDFIKKNFAKCGLVLVGFFFDFCFLTQKRLYEKNSIKIGDIGHTSQRQEDMIQLESIDGKTQTV